MPTSADLTIRPAAPEDRAALGRLGEMLVALHHGFDPRRFIPAGPQTAKGYGGWLVSQIGEPKVCVLVAVEAGAVVGYAYAAIEGKDWMMLRDEAGVLYDIVVDPDHRGKGVGRALLDRTVATLTERGAPRVVLSTATQNDAAQRLFASAGFRATMIEMTRDA